MFFNAARTQASLSGLFAAIFLILTAMPAEARSDAHRSFTLAGRQWLLIERMTNSALLAALGIDASPGLNSVHWSRDRFDRTQIELREGDAHLRLDPTTRPEILETLDRVDIRWRRYDSIFREITASPSISEPQIHALIQNHTTTTEALLQMVDAYEHFVHGGSNHTILSSTIDGAGQLRAHTQLVLRGLLTIAYNQSAVRERQRLNQASIEFDRTLNGLIHGDPELRLLPAPTQEIRDELRKVELMWAEAYPILESAASGNAVTKDEIAAVAQYASDMAVPLTMTLLMYLSL